MVIWEILTDEQGLGDSLRLGLDGVFELEAEIKDGLLEVPRIVVGGSPTFPAHASERGAPILCELAGYAAVGDAYRGAISTGTRSGAAA